MSEFGNEANIIFKLDTPRRVKLNFLQRLPDDIVGLAFALLSRLDCSGLV
jgi:hypothetical protein